MSIILPFSIAIRLAAAVWSAVVLWRLRDWRMGFLTAMLTLMALRQSLTLSRLEPSLDRITWATRGGLTELPGLLVSVLAALAVFFLERMLRSQREIAERLIERDARLRQSQKLEAIGTLAGGIAHDFNNLLTAIGGHAELAREELPPDSPAHETLDAISQAVERAAGITRQILGFARRRSGDAVTFDPRDALLGLIPTLRQVVTEGTELVVLADELPVGVRLDRTEFEQVLINLVVNARDAMPDGGAVTIRIREVGAEEAAERGLERSAHVGVSVSDTGEGIASEIRDRVFEPFFTTKPVGRGTGLGLSTCYGIVCDAGGALDVTSEVGMGSTFEALYPAVPLPVSRVASTSTPRRLAGDETVLLVEDEPQVRAAVGAMLQRRGYRVITASNGEEALREIERPAAGIDVLLTDMVMPRLGGRELARRSRERLPGLAVVYMSGYPEAAAGSETLVEGGVLLQKPFSSTQLARAVRDALEREGPRRLRLAR